MKKETLTLLQKCSELIQLPVSVYKNTHLQQLFYLEDNGLSLAPLLMAQYLESDYNICFLQTKQAILCGFVRDKKSGEITYVGPTASHELSRTIISDCIRDFHLPKNTNDTLYSYFHTVQTLSSSQFRAFLDLVNSIINADSPEEPIHLSSHFVPPVFSSAMDASSPSGHNLPKELEYEQMVLRAISEGDVERIRQIFQNAAIVNMTIPELGSTEVRSLRNAFISAVALSSRAAVNGGLDYRLALTLSDKYITTVEHLSSPNDIIALIEQMQLDYVTRVARLNNRNYASPTVRAVIKAIRTHIYSPLSLNGLAENLGVNPSYLSTLFKKETGMTITNYIQREKIEEAKYLMSISEKSIVEIAESLCFCNQQYFQRIFKKWTGCTPIEYMTR